MRRRDGQIPGRGPGRPSVLESGYQPETGTWEPTSPAWRILRSLAEGTPLKHAAVVGSVHPGTLREWRSRGVSLDVAPELDVGEHLTCYGHWHKAMLLA